MQLVPAQPLMVKSCDNVSLLMSLEVLPQRGLYAPLRCTLLPKVNLDINLVMAVACLLHFLHQTHAQAVPRPA